MADFATRNTHGLHFAHREGRKVVVQHKALGHVAGQRIHALFVGGRTKGGHNHGLGFATAEQGRTVRTGQHAGLNLDGAHGLGVAAVNARAFVNDAGAHQLLFQVRDDVANALERGVVFCPGRVALEGFHDLFFHSLAGVLAGHLFRHAHGFFQASGKGQLFHAGNQNRVFGRGGKGHLGLASQFAQLELGLNQGLNLLTAPFKSVDDDVFGHKAGFAFHHGERIGRGGKHDVEIALRLLFKGGVEHKLAVDAANAATGHRTGKGQGRQQHSGRSAREGQHVRVVFLVGRDNAGQHLHVFVQALFGKERTQRAVDEARNQGFTLGGTANFAAEKAAGNAASRVHLFRIFNGKGKEALVEFEALRAHGDKHHCAAALNPHRAVGLVGHAACFKDNFFAANLG